MATLPPNLPYPRETYSNVRRGGPGEDGGRRRMGDVVFQKDDVGVEVGGVGAGGEACGAGNDR